VRGTPTCYIFACPGNYFHNATPYHSLIPYGHSREPGLILISVSGELRFWDGIGIGLAGGAHYSAAHLGLASGEVVTNFIRADVSWT
jgi:nuclear pore complex protein Nup133